MAHFNLHFFKEKTRKIDIDYLMSYFESLNNFTTEIDETSVRFIYKNVLLNYQASFIITPKSVVPNIYRLNPKFLDVNFHLELPILTVDFCAKQVFEVAKDVTERFGLFVYNELFEDVLPFKMNYVMKAFTDVKDAYVERNPLIINDYFILPKDKLSVIYRYTNDIYDLQKYYHQLETYVPNYIFLETEGKTLELAIEWKEQTLTVFPPFLDYLVIRNGDKQTIISYKEFTDLASKYLEDVPGFIKDTKVIKNKMAKKVYKIIKKYKFTPISKKFRQVNLKYLLD